MSECSLHFILYPLYSNDLRVRSHRLTQQILKRLYEYFCFIRCLMMYGVRSGVSEDSDSEGEGEGETTPPPLTEDAVRDDPDLMLVPTILNKVVLPKITG